MFILLFDQELIGLQEDEVDYLSMFLQKKK